MTQMKLQLLLSVEGTSWMCYALHPYLTAVLHGPLHCLRPLCHIGLLVTVAENRRDPCKRDRHDTCCLSMSEEGILIGLFYLLLMMNQTSGSAAEDQHFQFAGCLRLNQSNIISTSRILQPVAFVMGMGFVINLREADRCDREETKLSQLWC